MLAALPSREHIEAYRQLRSEVEATIGRINGEYSALGSAAVHYLHQGYPRAEMAAMFLAADVMLVTPLRDGMNLVAKEYVACRHDLGGALVLSEFTAPGTSCTRLSPATPTTSRASKRRSWPRAPPPQANNGAG